MQILSPSLMSIFKLIVLLKKINGWYDEIISLSLLIIK